MSNCSYRRYLPIQLKFGVGERNIKLPCLPVKSLLEFVLALFGKLSIPTYYLHIFSNGAKIRDSVTFTKRGTGQLLFLPIPYQACLEEKRKKKQDGLIVSVGRCSAHACVCVCVCVMCVHVLVCVCSHAHMFYMILAIRID